MLQVFKVLIALLLFYGPIAIGLEADSEQKIFIESHELEVDDLNGVSEYRGAVIFRRGSILLEADEIKMYEQQHKLVRVVATGQPVKLRQELDSDRGETRAIADTMEYTISADSLLLKGNARLWQAGNDFSGDTIIYHIKDETVVAKGDKEQDGRVRIVIEPSEIQLVPDPPTTDVAPAEKIKVPAKPLAVEIQSQ